MVFLQARLCFAGSYYDTYDTHSYDTLLLVLRSKEKVVGPHKLDSHVMAKPHKHKYTGEPTTTVHQASNSVPTTLAAAAALG